MDNYTIQQIRSVLKKKGYLFFDDGNGKDLYNLNLVAVRSKDTAIDLFNDRFFCIYRKKEGWDLTKDDYMITTKPGKYYLENPIPGTKGTGILVPDQYRGVYSIGLFKDSYEALIQMKPMRLYRDNDRDDEIDIDPNTIETGEFGVCMHRASLWSVPVNVNNWSAACQVHPDHNRFKYFMSVCHKAEAIWGNKFTYTLLEEQDFVL